MKIWNLRVQKMLRLIKSLLKLPLKTMFLYIYGRKYTKYLYGTWSLLNILMIFGIKRKIIVIILAHTMYCWLLLQIYQCYLWLLLGSMVTYMLPYIYITEYVTHKILTFCGHGGQQTQIRHQGRVTHVPLEAAMRNGVPGIPHPLCWLMHFL